jgi:hypothetical protein
MECKVCRQRFFHSHSCPQMKVNLKAAVIVLAIM